MTIEEHAKAIRELCFSAYDCSSCLLCDDDGNCKLDKASPIQWELKEKNNVHFTS